MPDLRVLDERPQHISPCSALAYVRTSGSGQAHNPGLTLYSWLGAYRLVLCEMKQQCNVF